MDNWDSPLFHLEYEVGQMGMALDIPSLDVYQLLVLHGMDLDMVHENRGPIISGVTTLHPTPTHPIYLGYLYFLHIHLGLEHPTW